MITRDQFLAIMPLARGRVDRFLEPNNAAMDEFGIVAPGVVAAYLANLAHESAEFRYMEELADGRDYEDREDLDNHLPEAKACAPDGRAGPWFKGHGPLQITGYRNHLLFSEILFRDPEVLLRDPRRLCYPVDGCRAAAAFFQREGCIEPAAAGDFLMVCQIINLPPHLRGTTRAPNHWPERQRYYARAQSALGGS